jgi:hypothetical protein
VTLSDDVVRATVSRHARSERADTADMHRSWRCDDPEVAYPLYEKAQELGVNLLQFHKGLPFAVPERLPRPLGCHELPAHRAQEGPDLDG